MTGQGPACANRYYLFGVIYPYVRYCDKYSIMLRALDAEESCAGDTLSGPPSLTLADVDYCVMHSPFVKMVRKGFARMFYQDHLRSLRQSARQVAPAWPFSNCTSAIEAAKNLSH